MTADSRVQAAGDAVLRVRDLAVRFDSGRNVVHAVNGVSLELEAGGALGLVGESGSGKSVTSLAILRLLPRHTARVGGEVWFGGRDLIQLNDKDMRGLRGQGDLARPARSDERAEPRADHRRAGHRDDPGPRERAPGRGAAAGRGAAGRRRHPPAGRPAGPLPAPVQRRHAPARADRDRAGAPADAADRRRADHRPRRHGAGPGARAAPRAHRRARDRDPADQPRSGDHGADDAADRGDVRGPRGRVRAHRRGVRPPAPPLHRRAAPLDPPRRRRGRAADPDRRRTARRRPAAARLPVRPPVRLGAGGLLGGDAAARTGGNGRGSRGRRGPLSGPGAHLLACHNPVAPGEAEAGEPARPGFRPAPPPPGYRAVIEETA